MLTDERYDPSFKKTTAWETIIAVLEAIGTVSLERAHASFAASDDGRVDSRFDVAALERLFDEKVDEGKIRRAREPGYFEFA